jgi:transposase
MIETIISLGEIMVLFKKSSKKNIKFIDSDDLYSKVIDPNSLLVKIHEIVDFDHYRPILEPLYSEDGQHAYDCIFMFKICILQYLESISSERQTIKQIKTNLEYKYFLDLAIDDPVPHATKIGTFRKRLGEDKFKELFDEFVNVLRINNIITDDETRYMDATHQLADVSKQSINTLLAKSCNTLYKIIQNHEDLDLSNEIKFEINDFKLSEIEQKNRFVLLVEVAYKLQEKAKLLLENFEDSKLEEAYEIVNRIVKERSVKNGEKIQRKNSENKGKLASVSDKDATWGSKSKNYQFLGYKHNVTSTESGFIEVVSTHQGHKCDEEFYIEDAKKISGNKIVADTTYGSLDNRKKSKKDLHIDLVSPCRKNIKAHLHSQTMEDAFQYNQTEQYKNEMKKRGSIIEGIFGVMKKRHNFSRAKLRTKTKVSLMAQIAGFAMNLKALVKWYLAPALLKS